MNTLFCCVPDRCSGQYGTFASRLMRTCCRYLSCALHLDYDTMAGADKFGNFCVVRIPQDMSQIIEDDPTGGKAAAISGKLNSAPHKLEPLANFHAGDLIMSLQLCTLQQGGQEVCYNINWPV
jgi:splicing factor 3B subunit 3